MDVKEAVQKTAAVVGNLFPEAREIRLEEVERNDSQWSVVLSFKTTEPGSIEEVITGSPRLFKTVTIDAANGELIALKVWKN